MKWQAMINESWRAVMHHDLGDKISFLWLKSLTTVEFIPKVAELSENDVFLLANKGELFMNE